MTSPCLADRIASPCCFAWAHRCFRRTAGDDGVAEEDALLGLRLGFAGERIHLGGTALCFACDNRTVPPGFTCANALNSLDLSARASSNSLAKQQLSEAQFLEFLRHELGLRDDTAREVAEEVLLLLAHYRG